MKLGCLYVFPKQLMFLGFVPGTEGLSFDADYDLTIEGPGHVEKDRTVYFLHIYREPCSNENEQIMKYKRKAFCPCA